MSIVWVASYILLWILVAGVVVLDVGLLQQIGLLQNRLDEAKAKPVERLPGPPSIDEDGPTLGSMVPSVDAESANDFGAVQLPSPEANSGQTLIILLSAMCETCQQLVAPLNAFVGAQQDGEGDHVQVVAFLRADEHGARAFFSLFPLNLPVILDRDKQFTKALDVHRTPFGLLYSKDGALVRKGVLLGGNELNALLGDPSVPDEAKLQVHPAPVSEPHAPVEAQVGR